MKWNNSVLICFKLKPLDCGSCHFSLLTTRGLKIYYFPYIPWLEITYLLSRVFFFKSEASKKLILAINDTA